MEEVIAATGLSKRYGEVTAVDRVDLSIQKGELFGLLGPNGSGKTTIIRMLTGQVRPDEGGASVLGTDVLADPVGVRRAVGIVPEQETPPSFLTANEYLSFVADIRGMDPEVAQKRADKWFSLLDFEEAKDRLCKDLSRGTRQKLMCAQAFLHEPPVVLIDEPLINLDPVIQRRVKDYLREYTAGGGTVLLSTHILPIAAEICTRIGILHRGTLRFEGDVAALKEEHPDLEVFFLESVGGE